jgi:hypothetical protein
MSPYGTEHFKNAIRAHKHFLLNMGISGHIYACACIQWLKVVMTFHYAKYDRNPIGVPGENHQTCRESLTNSIT